MELTYAVRFSQIAGSLQVFRAEEAQEFGVLQKIIPGELDEFPHGVDRIAVAELQANLGGADAGVGFFKDGKIKPILPAEVVIDHALVDARARGDPIDAGSCQPVCGEFPRRRFKDRRTGAWRIPERRRPAT